MKDKKEEPIVLYTDENAASEVTVTGWVSRNGNFYGKNEHMARYDGCTHKKCECGELMERHWSKCKSCREKSSEERFFSYEYQEWNGEPLCLYDGDEYFWNENDVEDYLETNNLEPRDLKLLICVPIYFREIDSGYWEEEICNEDGELPKEFEEKLQDLNYFISKMKPSGYTASNVRTRYKRDE